MSHIVSNKFTQGETDTLRKMLFWLNIHFANPSMVPLEWSVKVRDRILVYKQSGYLVKIPANFCC